MPTGEWPRQAPLGRPSTLPRPALFDLVCPWRWVAWYLDQLDDGHARRIRGELGRRGWLLSWQPEPTRGWRARLSGSATVRTIERTGPNRRSAIRRARKAMARLIEFRARGALRGSTPEASFDAWKPADNE